MADPSFVPADFLDTPGFFGRGKLPEWREKPSDPVEQSRWHAARAQEELATRVRDRLRSRRREVRDLARELGWRPERLSRLLCGQAVISLSDFMLLSETSQLWPADVIRESSGIDSLEREERWIAVKYIEKMTSAMKAQLQSGR